MRQSPNNREGKCKVYVTITKADYLRLKKLEGDTGIPVRQSIHAAIGQVIESGKEFKSEDRCQISAYIPEDTYKQLQHYKNTTGVPFYKILDRIINDAVENFIEANVKNVKAVIEQVD